TYDTPAAKKDLFKSAADASGNPVYETEDLGITWWRMHHAVYKLVEKFDTLTPVREWVIDVTRNPKRPAAAKEMGRDEALERPFAIVNALRKLLKGYRLSADPNLAAYGHSDYFGDLADRGKGSWGTWRGGAWPIADYIEQRAQCQAICRFVRNVFLMVGLPGKPELVYVFADKAKPHEAAETKWSGHALDKEKQALLDQYVSDADVAAGVIFPPPGTKQKGKAPIPQRNNYEACLKYTFGQNSLYFGGGAGVYRNKESVLRVFPCFVEVEQVEYERDARGNVTAWGYRVTKVLQRYRGPKGEYLELMK